MNPKPQPPQQKSDQIYQKAQNIALDFGHSGANKYIFICGYLQQELCIAFEKNQPLEKLNKKLHRESHRQRDTL